MFYISFEDLDVLGLSLGGPGFRGPKFWALKFMGPSFWASGPGSRLCLPCLDSKAPSKAKLQVFLFRISSIKRKIFTLNPT